MCIYTYYYQDYYTIVSIAQFAELYPIEEHYTRI
jgi:hypothetical protein